MNWLPFRAGSMETSPQRSGCGRMGRFGSFSGNSVWSEMNAKKNLLLTLALFALPAMAKTGEFLPLQAGNTWVYQDAVSGASFTIKVGTPVMHLGNVYYPITGYADGKWYIRLGDEDGLVYYNEDRDAEYLF